MRVAIMKTSIRIPDKLVTSAGELARRLGISRTELFARAIADFVHRHHADGITQRVNAVCDQMDTALDPRLLRAQMALLPDERW
jgi:hypothetical protein